MKMNVSGSYFEISELVKLALDLNYDNLVNKILRGMKKSKYDETGKIWYFSIDNEEINEMETLIKEHSITGFSELALNFLRARCKEEAKTDDQ